ncbi:MAG: putative sulfate exporter family transporter [Sutterellaceae bacterium]|nr:putative sulfate exporter family transporter [Sutterellaceae bacterium]
MTDWFVNNTRGILISVAIALAGMLISHVVGGPAVLYAMMIGLAFHYLSENPNVRPGMEFCIGPVLRIGVALLGVRITAEELSHLTPLTLAVIVGGVFATIGFSVLIRRLVGMEKGDSALVGGSVAICGASAAIALSLVMDKKQLKEQTLLAVLVVVTVISTVAMLLYPLILEFTPLSGSVAGLVLGGSIHDVSQVVGAGAMMGEDALATATMTKMLRVAMLVPMIVIFAFAFKPKAEENDGEPKKFNLMRVIPKFLIAFVILAVVNVMGYIPKEAASYLVEISHFCVLVAIAALGMKTSLSRLRTAGVTVLYLLTIDTVFLFIWVLGGIWLAQLV